MTDSYALTVLRGNGKTATRFRNSDKFAQWGRELTDEEVESLKRNPWQMFKPLPERNS